LKVILFGEVAEGPLPVAQLLANLHTCLVENGQAIGQPELWQWVEDRLRYFGYFGLFSFSPST
jgi:hypothetical protein